MTIPYRTQRVLKRILLGLLALTVLLLTAWVCWSLWVQRYVVYLADGTVVIDFTKGPIQEGQTAIQPEKMEVPVHFVQQDELVDTSAELTQMVGYYVELSELQDIEAVKAQIQALPVGTPVMVDVKNIKGAFYYSSAVSATRSSQIHTEAFDELITTIKRSGMYAIARFPALRDYTYGLNHVPDGVHHISGGYLYMDDDGCYWLHPGSEGTLTYLTNIIMELRALGFDEVVLEDFCFPQTTSIRTDGDKAEHLSRAAKILTQTCVSERFAVSFVKTADFTVPEGRTRVYMTGMDASQAAAAAANSGVEDTAVKLVFLTELHDTRFNVYSVLRPLSGAG